jgi:hypothetical protein
MPGLALHPLSAGEVLDGAFQLYRRHFVVLFMTALIAYAPVALIYAFMGVPAYTADPGSGVAAAFLALILTGLATSIAWAALFHQFSHAVVGESVELRAGLLRGLRALIPLLFAGLLLYVALAAVMVPAFIATGAVMLAIGLALGESPAAVIVMATIIVLGGSVVLVWWLAVVGLTLPALVIERRGPIGAIKRGYLLAKGARMRITGLWILAWLIVMLPTLGTLMMFGMASTLWDPAAMSSLSTTQLYLQQLTTTLVGALTTPYLIGVAALLYYDRRVRREGYDLELAAAALSPATS